MSESKFETISSLVDNYRASTADSEAGEQVIDDMLLDASLTKAWQHYHLIGDVMRDELPSSLQFDITKEIANTIAEEPTVLTPSAETVDKAASNSESSNNIIDFKSRLLKAIKPVGQIAIAASAAGLMIIGVQQNTANNEAVLPSQIVQTIPFGGQTNPVSFNFQSDKQLESNSLTQQQARQQVLIEKKIKQQRRFQALFLDHKQQIKLINSTPK